MTIAIVEEKAVRMVERYGGRQEARVEATARYDRAIMAMDVTGAFFWKLVIRVIERDLGWSGKNVELASRK
jgi:hypothetical protein